MKEAVFPFLAFMKFYLISLNVNEGGTEVPILKSKRATAVKGLVVTICGIEKIMTDILGNDEHDLMYVLFC